MIDGAVSAHCPAGALATEAAHWGPIILQMTTGTYVDKVIELLNGGITML